MDHAWPNKPANLSPASAAKTRNRSRTAAKQAGKFAVSLKKLGKIAAICRLVWLERHTLALKIMEEESRQEKKTIPKKKSEN